MTRREKLIALEQELQQGYDTIQKCYQTITATQFILEELEPKYLSLKRQVDNLAPEKKARITKANKLRKFLLKLGIGYEDVEKLLEQVK